MSGKDCKLKKLVKVFEGERSENRDSDSVDFVQESKGIIDSFFENTVNQRVPTPLAGEINRLELRSGHHYSNIPPERDSIPAYKAPLPPPPNMIKHTLQITAAPTRVAPSPIRVILTQIIIRQYSGSDKDYTARQFLDLREAAIVNSSVTEDHDKIAFIRSRLLPGSHASHMMQ